MVKHTWLLGVLLSVSLWSPITNADTTTAKPADVRIVVDISGSMKETDPNNLRVPAVNLLADLLPNGAQGGLWAFGRQVNMMVPPSTVNDAWRKNTKEKAQLINSSGLYTNLTEAIDRASWKVSADSGFDHSLIVLTDGRIDMREPGAAADIDASERKRLIETVLPKFTAAGARIHTLALSDAADKELLQQIAQLTGGLYLEAHTADDLLKVFLKAFDRAVPAEQVPMTDNRFVIDKSVKEFTALIFRKPGSTKNVQLVAPDGTIYSAENSGEDRPVRWARELNFDLITIIAPEPGEWHADAEIDPDNRVQILSDLKLRVRNIPSVLFAGTPVTMDIALTEKDQVVTEKALLAATEVVLTVTAPDGRRGSRIISNPEQVPDSGIFTETLSRLSEEGQYQFEITAISKTFERRQTLTASLMQAMVFNSANKLAEQIFMVTASPAESVKIDNTKVMATITYPDESSIVLDVAYNAEQHMWELPLTETKGPGKYSVILRANGNTQANTRFSAESKVFEIVFPMVVKTETTAFESPAREVVEEKEPAEGTPEIIVPDLAQKFAEQQAAEEAAAEQPQPESETPMIWWIYLVIAGITAAIFGGGAYMWLRGRPAKPSSVSSLAMPKEPEQPTIAAAPPRPVPEDLIREDINIDQGIPPGEEMGDFDSFEGEQEVEIPMPADDAGDSDMPTLDDEFAIDPDEDFGDPQVEEPRRDN